MGDSLDQLYQVYADERLGTGLVNYEMLMSHMTNLRTIDGDSGSPGNFPFDQTKNEHDINLLKQHRKNKQTIDQEPDFASQNEFNLQ